MTKKENVSFFLKLYERENLEKLGQTLKPGLERGTKQKLGATPKLGRRFRA